MATHDVNIAVCAPLQIRWRWGTLWLYQTNLTYRESVRNSYRRIVEWDSTALAAVPGPVSSSNRQVIFWCFFWIFFV